MTSLSSYLLFIFEKISYKQFKKDIANDKDLYDSYELPYRSTKNIMDYAGNILNIKFNCFRNAGNKVIESKIDKNIKENIINNIKSFNNKRTAIITSSRQESEYLYKLLQNELDVSSPLFDIKKTNIIIVPVYVAKGLEFDSVIVYNSKSFSKKLLYVAVTRAQNNLIIYY